MTDDQAPASAEKRVNAVPAKRFFVGMLVKDIELVPAIIDLVDNSVDGGKRLRPSEGPKRYQGLHVKVSVSEERFEIEDNCGGIDLDWAREYAFRFGRAEDVDGPLGEVGQFGVGMKRALFKIGSRFTVTSTAPHSSFTLPVDVRAWMKDTAPDWSFTLSDVAENERNAEAATGTLLEVADLHPTVASEFGDDDFGNRLREELRLRQARVISQGLMIYVNNELVESFEPELLNTPDVLQPIVVQRTINVDGESLDMRLYAGLVRMRDNDADRDDDDAAAFREPPDAGWYLYCNDRLLIAADRTRLTGWGESGAAYHPQYRQFRGYVFLSGPSQLMPWTTTKTSVDEDSPVFAEVQNEMIESLGRAQAAMNRIKTERQRSPEGERPAFDAVRTAEATPLQALNPSAKFVLPEPAPKRPVSDVKWIRYSVAPRDFHAVAETLGVTAAVDVGRETFNYFLEEQASD